MQEKILKKKEVSAAKFFLTYLVFGMLSLLIVIAASVYFRDQKYEVTWALAISILVSNFLAVWGYAAAILRRSELLSDPEAPDLAYYLGFSLTVGALSFSFLADLGALQAANPQEQATLRSGLVSGSLAQFGAGLLATLIGLSFKIYLTSQQYRSSSDPTEMYNQFRTEVSSFSSMLRNLSTELTSSISQASSEIQRSGELAGRSMTELSETLQRASEAISVNITHERISAPVDRFIDELESISTPLKNANEAIVDLNKQTKDANLSIKAAASEYLAASQVVRQSATSIDAFSISINNLNPDLEELNLKLGEFLSVCNSGTSSLKILTENTNLTATEIFNNATKLQELTPAVGDTIEKLTALSGDILQVSQNARLLSGCVLELVQGTSAANQVSGEFANTLSETAQHTQNLILKLDDMSDACMDGLNSLQDFQQATNTSAFTANNFAQSLQATGDIVATATSNMTLFADSVITANTEVASYTREVNAGTQEFRQSISNFVTGSNGANQSIGVFSATLDNTNRLTLSLNNQLTGLASSADGGLQALNKLESSALSAAELTGGFGSTVKDASESIEKANVEVKNLSESAVSANTELSKLSNSTNSLNVASASQVKVVDAHLAQSTKFIENYQHILNSVERQQNLLGELDTKLNSLIMNITNLSSNSSNKQS
jgi:chromosome segregation ATPase